MSIFELFLIAVGLSMDAFAVAVCKGLSIRKANFKNILTVGLYFGVFQALMPLAGYLAGVQFADKITMYAHWIAFILLGIIGLQMIKNSFNKGDLVEESSEKTDSLSPKKMFPLAIATSIDALAIGITFAILNVNILPSVSLIGITTLLLSMLGVKIGNVFGTIYKAKAEFAGGVILVLMGIKILAEHLGII